MSSLTTQYTASKQTALCNPVGTTIIGCAGALTKRITTGKVQILYVVPNFALAPLMTRAVTPRRLGGRIGSYLLHQPTRPRRVTKPVIFLTDRRTTCVSTTAVRMSNKEGIALGPNCSCGSWMGVF